MDTQDFVTRTSVMMGELVGKSSLMTLETTEYTMVDHLAELEAKSKKLLGLVLNSTDFSSKYDITSKEPGNPMLYVYTVSPSKYFLLIDAFTAVVKSDKATSRQVEEFEYHSLFEGIIKHYTKMGQKPNPALKDSRASEFCYRLTIKIEAVPAQTLKRAHRLMLLREFLILKHLWESFYIEVMANVCALDQMIGFPMPFEFINVTGSEYDLQPNEENSNTAYYNPSGKLERYMQAPVPSILPMATSTTMASSLSYMSCERLGPSLAYLLDLMRTQNKAFTVSTALKIYDQIICRFMIMHKYGVTHCDPNPTCFFFGAGETCNVLYISEFGAAIVRPESGNQIKRFHDRFVSHVRIREKKCHYVNDLESAFYIFLYLIMGRLPWDMRMAENNKVDSITATTMGLRDKPLEGGFTEIAVTVDDKEKFWQSQEILNRVFRIIDLEFNESLYESFSVDLIESLYSKTKEIITSFARITPNSYLKELSVPGSQVYNFYFGLRRIIATYFRFETISPALKDTQCASKIELLIKQCTSDKRKAWDLSHWCWNYLDPRTREAQKSQARSKVAQAH